MKIRIGFISNSSSSSFVVIATVTGHHKAMSALNAFQQEVITKIMKPGNVFGQDMMVGGGFSCHGEGTISSVCDNLPAMETEDDEDEMHDRVYMAWDIYTTELRKNTKEAFVKYIDF